MTVPSSTHAVVSTQPQVTSSNQKAFENKANETVQKVVSEVLRALITGNQMEWPQFVATYISPKQQALAEMDERTSKFFRKMMDVINPMFADIAPSFNKFKTVSQDPEIDKKLIEGIALPHVKTMIADLDKIERSIVDNVINS